MLKYKYLKYKKKYKLLKYQIGGNDQTLQFIGEGGYGCILCPPIILLNPIEILEQTPEYNKMLNNCNYVGKILRLRNHSIKNDNFEDEYEKLQIIKDLDPNGEYTPKFIFAGKYNGDELKFTL
jgi:hypothetical protein